MKERLREKPPQQFRVNGKWDMAYWMDLPYAKAHVEFDLSNIKPRTHNKLLKMIEMYPKHPGKGYGWSSECNQLFRMLARAYKLPKNRIESYGMTIDGATDKALWNEVWELCYADAIAERMAHGRSWALDNLVRYKDRDIHEGTVRYWHGSTEFYKAFQSSDTYRRLEEFVRSANAERLEKIYAIAAYGGLVRLEITY